MGQGAEENGKRRCMHMDCHLPVMQVCALVHVRSHRGREHGVGATDGVAPAARQERIFGIEYLVCMPAYLHARTHACTHACMCAHVLL